MTHLLNMSTFWMGVNLNKDEDESHNHLIQDRKQTVSQAENKQDKAQKLYLGNIDEVTLLLW